MLAAKLAMRTVRPKRFFVKASVELTHGQYLLLLDGRKARTPGRAPLALPNVALADAVAAEWAACGERIDPAGMPMTRLANSTIDGVAKTIAPTQAEITAYAGNDLLYYRAEEPEDLVARQAAAFDPILEWARETYGAQFVVTTGVLHAAQPAPTLTRLKLAVATFVEPFALAALHLATTLTGSALLALALARGRLAADEAWANAHVDEDFQISQWGADDEAVARRTERRRDFEAAAFTLRSLRVPQ